METKISKHGLLWPPRDPASAISHLLGFVLAVVGTVFLIIQGNRSDGLVYAWSFGIFGLTMTLLYLASASYHWFNLNERGNLILRKLDHAMIYVLIAGSYTPLCIIVLKGIWGTSMLASIWAIALGGIFLTLFYFKAPRWLTTGIYILMGWLLLVSIVPLSRALPLAGFAWLVGGGVFYTVGGVIYGLKRSLIHFPGFGFHEVFHIFILAGSTCIYLLMLLVLAQM